MAHGLIDKTVEFEDDDRNQVAKPYGYKNFFKNFRMLNLKYLTLVIEFES